MTPKTIAEAAAELRKLHAEVIEAGDAPGGVYSLKSHMEADVRFIRAAKDNVQALLDALERDIKIDKDIPLPNLGRPIGQSPPFAIMEVGDSFVLPQAEHIRARNAANKYGRYYGKKFAIRTIVENGEKVARLWRVS